MVDRAIAAELAEQVTAKPGKRDQGEDGGQQLDAGPAGRRAQNALEVDGEEEQRPDGDDAMQEGQDEGRCRGPVFEEMFGYHGVRREPRRRLEEEEAHQSDHAEH